MSKAHLVYAGFGMLAPAAIMVVEQLPVEYPASTD